MCESQVNPGDEDVPIFSEEWSNEDEDNRIVILKAEICKKDAQLNELSRCLNEAQQSCKEWERTARSYETIIKQAEERVDVIQAKIEPKTITPSDTGKLEVATMTEEMMKPTLTLRYDEAPNLGNLEILLVSLVHVLEYWFYTTGLHSDWCFCSVSLSFSKRWSYFDCTKLALCGLNLR